MSVRILEKKKAYSLIVLGYVVLLFVLLSRHEYFRDEAQQWLLARDLSVSQLIRQMSYEGHPSLWYFVLMPFAKMGFPFGTANVISIIMMGATAAFLLWRGPMHPVWKTGALLTSGFLFYGSVLGRSYCLIPLLLVLNASLYHKRSRRPFAYGLTIALLIQTHVVMLGMMAVMCLTWFVEAINYHRKKTDFSRLLRQAGGLMLPLISVLFLGYQLVRVENASAMRTNFAITRVAVKRMFRHLENFFMIYPATWKSAVAMACVVAVIVLTMCAIYDIRKKNCAGWELLKIVFIAVAGIGIAEVFSAWIYQLAEHTTMIICYVAVWFMWTSCSCEKSKWSKTAVCVVYALICTAWILNNVSSTLQDWKKPYSDMQNCAKYIVENIGADDAVVGVNGCITSGVVVYLEDHVVYSQDSGEKMTYCNYERQDVKLQSYEDLQRWTQKDFPEADCVYLLMEENRKLADTINLFSHEEKVECVYQTQGDAINDRYKIYRIGLK